VLTAVSILEAAESLARVMSAEEDARWVGNCPGGVMILILSTVRVEGIKALITDRDVPGGSDARYNVGLGAALSSSSSALSASDGVSMFSNLRWSRREGGKVSWERLCEMEGGGGG
jgi:hypothetical protein